MYEADCAVVHVERNIVALEDWLTKQEEIVLVRHNHQLAQRPVLIWGDVKEVVLWHELNPVVLNHKTHRN